MKNESLNLNNVKFVIIIKKKTTLKPNISYCSANVSFLTV